MFNHPNIDGNDRMGFEAMFAMLESNGFQMEVNANEAYDTIIAENNGQLVLMDNGMAKSVQTLLQMICRDTVEDKIMRLQEKQRLLAKELVTDDTGFV